MFARQPLRTEVQKEILARLADGRLAAGSRINETHLSADLGISRTPLREAMLAMEALGFLGSDPGRGFLVPPLAASVFLESQTILARLEPLALTTTMPLESRRIMELNNLIGRAKLRVLQPGPEQGATVAELVYNWAGLLVAESPNRLLAGDIMRLEGLSRRYWTAAVVDGFGPADLVGSLEQMYDLVRTDQSARAASHWSDHILRFGPEAARSLPAG